MKKVIYLVLFLLLLGCGGGDDMPCLNCENDAPWWQSNNSYVYCLYSNSSGYYSCSYMSASSSCNGTRYNYEDDCEYDLKQYSSENVYCLYYNGSSYSCDYMKVSSCNYYNGQVYNSSNCGKSSSSGFSSSSRLYSSSSSYPSSSSSYPSSSSLATYNITYNANGGSGAPSAQIKTQNVSLTLSNTVPTRTGYTFNGWNTAPDGSGTAYAAGSSYTANAAVTLYAKWTDNSAVDYEGETYKWVNIGNQTWLNRNLNYNAPGSKCYGEGGLVYNDKTRDYDINLSTSEFKSNCSTYGRLYDWATAMALEKPYCNTHFCGSQISTPHKGICPPGWHIPSKKEWEDLARYISSNKGCTDCDAKHLKFRTGWTSNVGLDSYGFAALPGGICYIDATNGSLSFDRLGDYGYWHSSEEYSGQEFSYRSMRSFLDDANSINYNKSYLYSIRCLKD